MTHPVFFLTRVVLRNYKSIASCDAAWAIELSGGCERFGQEQFSRCTASWCAMR